MQSSPHFGLSHYRTGACSSTNLSFSDWTPITSMNWDQAVLQGDYSWDTCFKSLCRPGSNELADPVTHVARSHCVFGQGSGEALLLPKKSATSSHNQVNSSVLSRFGSHGASLFAVRWTSPTRRQCCTRSRLAVPATILMLSGRQLG